MATIRDATLARAKDVERLKALQVLRQSDPDNPRLLLDILKLAYALGQFAEVIELSIAAQRLEALDTAPQNLRGLSYIWLGRHEEAIDTFRKVLAQGDDLQVRYNLAMTLAITAQYGEALEMLDEAVVGKVPAAGALLLRCLHHLGRLDEAERKGKELLMRQPTPETVSALALVALDLGRWDELPVLATQIGNHGDAALIHGFIAIHEGQQAQAETAFKDATTLQPNNGRAVLGLGLTELLGGEVQTASATLQRAAALMNNHVGSWVAAGWACLIASRLADAQACIQRAIEIEPRFAEAQGAAAVVALYLGEHAKGKRLAERAMRLDRRCLSGAYARILILEADGKLDAARALRKLTLDMPIGANSQTVAQAIARIGLRAQDVPPMKKH